MSAEMSHCHKCGCTGAQVKLIQAFCENGLEDVLLLKQFVMTMHTMLNVYLDVYFLDIKGKVQMWKMMCLLFFSYKMIKRIKA